MKQDHIILLIVIALMFSSASLFSQPTYSLQFRLEQNEGVANGIYEVTAQIRANGSDFKMGSGNLVFTYDTTALNSPAPIGPGPDSLHLQAIHNFSGGDYQKMTLTEPAPGRMSLNIELDDPDTGATVPQSFVDIATIRFTIEDFNIDPALTWRTASPNPLTVFIDDEATLVDSNTLSAEVLLADVKVFLEGPYSGGSMSTALNTAGYIPLSQPFNTAPWNYAGTESVSSIPTDVVDWVLLEIRSDTQPTDSITSRAAFIKNDGMIVDLNGTKPVTFDLPDNNYHVVIFHRNHLAAMNANLMPLNKASNETPYDFTTGLSQFYGNAGAHELSTGIWGMVTGDGNGDGGVFAEDYTLYQLSQGAEGYELADFNLDGGVFAEDYTFYQLNQGEETGANLDGLLLPNPAQPSKRTNLSTTKDNSSKTNDRATSKNKTSKSRTNLDRNE